MYFVTGTCPCTFHPTSLPLLHTATYSLHTCLPKVNSPPSPGVPWCWLFQKYMYVRGRFASGDWNSIKSYPVLQEITSIAVQLVVPKLPAHRPALVCKVNQYVFSKWHLNCKHLATSLSSCSHSRYLHIETHVTLLFLLCITVGGSYRIFPI